LDLIPSTAEILGKYLITLFLYNKKEKQILKHGTLENNSERNFVLDLIESE
jgi:hypothetical protein